jgi:phage tail-like protein
MATWKGRGRGRTAGQPTPTFRGGPGSGGGRAGAQPRVEIEGGAGRGGGRAGPQPRVETSGGGSSSGRTTLPARVEFGGTSRRVSDVSSAPDSGHRAHTSIGQANGERSPRVADPEGNFIFALEIEGIEIAQFKECSGIKSTTQVFELQEGGMNHRVHKLPGQSKWENIVLRYAVTADVSLLTWRNEILQDDFAPRRNGSIVMKTLTMEEVRRYNFIQGWPVSWEGPHFQATSADLAVEMIEIAHAGIQVT